MMLIMEIAIGVVIGGIILANFEFVIGSIISIAVIIAILALIITALYFSSYININIKNVISALIYCICLVVGWFSLWSLSLQLHIAWRTIRGFYRDNKDEFLLDVHCKYSELENRKAAEWSGVSIIILILLFILSYDFVSQITYISNINIGYRDAIIAAICSCPGGVFLISLLLMRKQLI